MQTANNQTKSNLNNNQNASQLGSKQGDKRGKSLKERVLERMREVQREKEEGVSTGDMYNVRRKEERERKENKEQREKAQKRELREQKRAKTQAKKEREAAELKEKREKEREKERIRREIAKEHENWVRTGEGIEVRAREQAGREVLERLEEVQKGVEAKEQAVIGEFEEKDERKREEMRRERIAKEKKREHLGKNAGRRVKITSQMLETMRNASIKAGVAVLQGYGVPLSQIIEVMGVSPASIRAAVLELKEFTGSAQSVLVTEPDPITGEMVQVERALGTGAVVAQKLSKDMGVQAVLDRYTTRQEKRDRFQAQAFVDGDMSSVAKFDSNEGRDLQEIAELIGVKDTREQPSNGVRDFIVFNIGADYRAAKPPVTIQGEFREVEPQDPSDESGDLSLGTGDLRQISANSQGLDPLAIAQKGTQDAPNQETGSQVPPTHELPRIANPSAIPLKSASTPRRPMVPSGVAAITPPTPPAAQPPSGTQVSTQALIQGTSLDPGSIHDTVQGDITPHPPSAPGPQAGAQPEEDTEDGEFYADMETAQD